MRTQTPLTPTGLYPLCHTSWYTRAKRAPQHTYSLWVGGSPDWQGLLLLLATPATHQ
jgi:hypothetical protein